MTRRVPHETMPEAKDSALRPRPGWPAQRLDPGDAASRLNAAFELFDVALKLLRARLAREHPDWSQQRIDRALAAWLHDRSAPAVGPDLVERKL